MPIDNKIKAKFFDLLSEKIDCSVLIAKHNERENNFQVLHCNNCFKSIFSKLEPVDSFSQLFKNDFIELLVSISKEQQSSKKEDSCKQIEISTENCFLKYEECKSFFGDKIKIDIIFIDDWVLLRVVKDPEYYKLVNDLLDAKINLERESQAKSDFLAMISHEMRSPLHGILSYSRFGVKKTKKDNLEEQTEEIVKLNEYFCNILESGSKILEFVEDLLDLSKMESGKMIFCFDWFSFKDVISSLQREFDALLMERHLGWDISYIKEDTRIFGDKNRIAQVIRNLFSNAVKFAPPGTAIRLTFEHDNCNGPNEKLVPAIKITVEDCGVGIDRKDEGLVFEKYMQGSRSGKYGCRGSGLGLAISREIVENHSGKIWFTNNQNGVGVKFIVILPVEAFNESSIII